jgi:protein translocase SecG subunit
MKQVFLIIQFVVAVGLMSLILLQTSKGGLNAQMGGADFYRTKRGAEKIVFTATIILSVLFFLITVINAFVIA